jgi:hypothetical protein
MAIFDKLNIAKWSFKLHFFVCEILKTKIPPYVTPIIEIH